MISDRLTTDVSAIKTSGLTKMYNNTLVVNGLDMDVPRGCIYGFLGLNGAGKTTTIKMLLNLVFPTSGEGSVMGFDIVRESLRIRDLVGFVAEEPVMYEYMKVSEIIGFCRDTYSRWDMRTVGKYLDLFELSVGKKIRDFSKGMKNQLALALALGSSPELLILDEPTSGLDPLKTKDFYRVILEQVAETGQTVFFSSHRLFDVERVADRVGIIHRGKLVFEKEMDDIKMNLKRIRIVFDRPVSFESLEQFSGVKSVLQQGRGYVVDCEQDPERLAAKLQEMNPVDMEIFDVSLEDVFIRYTGGGSNG